MISNLFLLNRSLSLQAPRFPVATGVFVVGRSSGCDLVVPHVSVSRRHAELQVLGDCVTVVDLDSRNGTFVDDARIKSSSLAVGQKVTFGGVPFLLMSEDRDAECCDSSIETADHRDKLRIVLPETVASKLSWAERRVLLHLVDGLTEKETAERLRISPHTVHNHVREIYGTLDVHSRAELMALILKY
jgi:DNA-binding CsgD family transcriptional regulator